MLPQSRRRGSAFDGKKNKKLDRKLASPSFFVVDRHRIPPSKNFSHTLTRPQQPKRTRSSSLCFLWFGTRKRETRAKEEEGAENNIVWCCRGAPFLPESVSVPRLVAHAVRGNEEGSAFFSFFLSLHPHTQPPINGRFGASVPRGCKAA